MWIQLCNRRYNGHISILSPCLRTYAWALRSFFTSERELAFTFAICRRPKIVPAEPSIGGVKRKGVAKYSDFGPIEGCILQIVRYRRWEVS